MTQDMVLEDKMFRIEFQKIGITPIQVKADSKIHIMAKCKMENGRKRFYYGYSGAQFATIPDQDQVFKVESSSFDQNGSSYDFGQFPYILYAK